MKQDPRINAKSMTLGHYIGIFLFVLFFCGSYAGLYFLQIHVETTIIYIMLSMLTYIVGISVVVCIMIAVFRKRYLMVPVYRISEAARKVTQGDFSVRLKPMRRDGKKDEFEVLFDDFNTMVEELASTEMLKTDFVSNVSHEIKTPLAVIQNYATILQNDNMSEVERKEYLRKIGDASERLTILVTNILQVNRLENQKIKPVFKPFNLSEQMCRCIIGFDTLLDEKEIELDTQLDQNLIMKSDENLLDIVWNNLLSNAIKFTDKGGRIGVYIGKEVDKICVSVKDTGCGISEEAIKHIFDKFYQEDTSHATQGNGLGLALAKRIINLLDGEIVVESVLKEGTTFKVYFKT